MKNPIKDLIKKHQDRIGKEKEEIEKTLMTQKMELYRNKKYTCPVPPVHTAYWTPVSWIVWIDTHGKWLLEEETCCGGIPVRNGKCPVCGEHF